MTSGCAYLWPHNEVMPLSEREIIFENSRHLMAEQKFAKAESLLQSLVAKPESYSDVLYDNSLWSLSLVFEKGGYPEKAILSLKQLLDRRHEEVSRFKILTSLMKNYFRVGNRDEALNYKKIIDLENPKFRINADAVYLDLLQTLNLNFDYLILEELDYVAQVQKYLLFVMEQKTAKSNQHATELLISIYERTFQLLKKDNLSEEFKTKILVMLLDNLHRFHNYKLDDLDSNTKTIAKFTSFSQKLEKQITDWLHQ